MSHLQNPSRISVSQELTVYHLSALSDDVMLLACGAAGLHALSLSSNNTSPFGPADIGDVYRVVFDAYTDTLLLLVKPPRAAAATGRRDYWQLVSLSREENAEWLEVQRLTTAIQVPAAEEVIALVIAVCDSRVLLAGRAELRDPLYVFDVSASHYLSHAAKVSSPNWFYGLACARRGDETLVAFSHETEVSLQRLESQSFKKLASVELSDPDRLLFRGHMLLVADWNKKNSTPAIKSLSAFDDSLTEKVLCGYRSGVRTRVWALAGDRLVSSSDQKLNNLLVHTIVA